MECKCCGEHVHRVYGFYCDSYGGWICFECYSDLRDELED